ncbi:hypothetical protein ST4_041 [Aeromonas phage ST4]|nr:hypothetical protein ST4_041 [Aeromonas phage ST4]
MKGTIAYIAGPITGRLETYEQEFAAAAAHLKGLGAVVLNPAMLPIGLKSHQSYMNICLPMLREAEAIVMLPGWQDSKGAQMELDEARRIGMPVWHFIHHPPHGAAPTLEVMHHGQ